MGKVYFLDVRSIKYIKVDGPIFILGHSFVFNARRMSTARDLESFSWVFLSNLLVVEEMQCLVVVEECAVIHIFDIDGNKRLISRHEVSPAAVVNIGWLYPGKEAGPICDVVRSTGNLACDFRTKVNYSRSDFRTATATPFSHSTTIQSNKMK